MNKKPKSFKQVLDDYLSGKASREEEEMLESIFNTKGFTNPDDNTLSEKDAKVMLESFKTFYWGIEESHIEKEQKGLIRFLSRLRKWQVAALLVASVITLLAIRIVVTVNGGVDYIEEKTFNGQTRNITLPDGSVIMLNARSTLAYHPSFANNRMVRLDGEAWFDVKADKEHPFIIETSDGLCTQVLGTSFNVSSYSENSVTKIIVQSGSVRVLRSDSILGTLKENNSLTYDRITHQASLEKKDDFQYKVQWMKGKWIYDRVSYKELALLIETQYGITLLNDSDRNITAESNINFHKQQSPEDIVGIFCELVGYKYTWVDSATIKIY